MTDEQKNLKAISDRAQEIAIENFQGKKRRDWTQADWLEFLDGWQYARLRAEVPQRGGNAQIRKLGIFVAGIGMIVPEAT